MNKVTIFLLFALLFVGCGEYQKVKKSSNAEFKLKKAIEYYNDKQYAKTLDLLNDIKLLYKGRSKEQTIEYYIAHCLFQQKDYREAGYTFNQLIRTFPNTPYAEECLYMKAYCYYKFSPVPLLDQAPTESAINAFKLYMKRYPSSTRLDDCKKYVAELEDKLVEKSYLSAKTYFDREYYDSAIIALQNSLREYPNSSHREEILFMLLESRYELAANSVKAKQRDRYEAAKEEYYTYAEEFPESKNKSRADRIAKNIDKYLGTK